MKLQELLNEGSVSWPNGHTIVTNTFKIGGGAWRMTFNKGTVIRITTTPEGQKVERWDPFKEEYVAKTPPISGNRQSGTFDLSDWEDRDAQSWVNEFEKNTKTLSSGQADTATKAMAATKVLKARDAIKMLQSMQGSQRVKITVVK